MMSSFSRLQRDLGIPQASAMFSTRRTDAGQVPFDGGFFGTASPASLAFDDGDLEPRDKHAA